MNDTATADAAVAEAAASPAVDPSVFTVSLTNFSGPFDLLLDLISQRRLDVTEVALHAVTDDFIAYTKNLGTAADLDQITQFLVVAATLLDLKAARLLPRGEVEDADDLELLDARDLLFARLLQYRAYKQVAVLFAELEASALQRYPRAVSLEPRYEELLPEVALGVDAWQFAQVAAAALAPKPVPQVGLSHLHDVDAVSVPEQVTRVGDILRRAGTQRWVDFGTLASECASGLEVVARFLALLELYRQKAVEFEQSEALGMLHVRWSGERDTAELVTTTAEDYG